MDLIQQGQKISINIIKQETLVEIIGTINEVRDDRLIVDLPPYFMRYIEFLDVGCVVTAKIFSKIGTIDFNSMIISSPLEEGNLEMELDVNALKLTPGSELPVIDSIENLKIIRKDGVIFTQTFEISTDYIKFYSEKKLEIDESFACELNLPSDYGTISFKVTVSAQDVVYENEYTANIFSMSEQDREILLYYMYVYASNKPDEPNETEETAEASDKTKSEQTTKQE